MPRTVRRLSRLSPLASLAALFRLACQLGLLAPLAACTGAQADSGPAGDADTDADTDTDTSPDVVPVWTNSHIETSSTFHGVYASGSGTYIVGTDGKAFVGTASVGFTEISPSAGVDLRDLWGSGAGDALQLRAAGHEGHILSYSSEVWADTDLGTNNFEGIGGAESSALYSVGWGGIYESDGADWNFVTPPGGARFNDVWGAGEDAIAVGEGGEAAVRSGGGWQASVTPVTVGLHAVSGSAANDVWAVGEAGTILHWDGVTWSAVASPVTVSIWGVWVADANNVFIVGDNGVALHYNGSIWIDLPTGVNNNLYAVHGSSATNVWAVGNLGAAIQYKPS
ncbi:MAG: hypothetical protein EXR69_16550 [Myxococcales bacterium]|nr:hypothetical protein [Myxococcales bacterium]